MAKRTELDSNALYWVRDGIFAPDFPDVENTLMKPDGLLAIGGNLSEERLLTAYRMGIFPWFHEGHPILWWSPDPRCVLRPKEIKISRSLSKKIRRNHFCITFNNAFSDVIEGCAEIRRGTSQGTWITNDMKTAYLKLFMMGYAHSVECWKDDQLAGGLYGLAMGKIFFGESMFSRHTDASKVALAGLAGQLQRRDFKLIDCQVVSKHLQMLGAKSMRRSMFINILKTHCSLEKTTQWDTPANPCIMES